MSKVLEELEDFENFLKCMKNIDFNKEAEKLKKVKNADEMIDFIISQIESIVKIGGRKSGIFEAQIKSNRKFLIDQFASKNIDFSSKELKEGVKKLTIYKLKLALREAEEYNVKNVEDKN